MASFEVPEAARIRFPSAAPSWTAYGKGPTPQAALDSAFGEAVERYSTIFQGTERTLWGTVGKAGDAALSPAALQQFHARQYKDRDAWNYGPWGYPWIPEPCPPDLEISWTPVWSLTLDEPYLAPTQCCYFGCSAAGAPPLARADSNGCAAGVTLEAAILNATLELIERDAIALWWVTMTHRPAAPWPASAEAAAIREFFALDGRTVQLLYLTQDILVPVVAAVAADNGTGGRIALGFGASFDVAEATLRALREAVQNAPAWQRRPDDCAPGSMERAHSAWVRDSTLANSPHLVPSGAIPGNCPPLPCSLQDVLRQFRERGWNLCCLDLSRPETRTPAVRMLCPDLALPYYRLGSSRLENALPEGGCFNSVPFAL